MITVRPAQEADVGQIRNLFVEVYGKEYPHREVYDERWLKSSVFSDDVLMLVAEKTESGTIVGTASVLCDLGAYSDLVGEFGRLAVHPEARQEGTGTLLMEKRIEAVRDRLHLGLALTRTVHPYSQQISLSNRFTPVGFLPLRHLFSHRESFAPTARYFGDALAMRKNNPRIIPEAYPLAHHVMRHVTLPCDLIVDEEAAPYPGGALFRLEELRVEGCPALLRIERGRVRHREIFGSMRLEYGFFKLRARHATYFLAMDEDRIAGAIGFTLDPTEHTVTVFELISWNDQVVRFLLSELQRKCRDEQHIEYIEIDVSAHAPRMQRTLLELGFLPAAYIPAMVFHEVERLDVMRMVWLVKLGDLGPLGLTPEVKEVADLVMQGFTSRAVAPQLARAVAEIPLFHGLSDEQVSRLAGVCSVKEFHVGERIFREADSAQCVYIVLNGRVGISVGSPPVGIGIVEKGEAFGELSMLSANPHSGTASAETRAETAVLTNKDLADLIRRRPDIGVVIYKNLAMGLGKKLLRSDNSLRDWVVGESDFLHVTLTPPREVQ